MSSDINYKISIFNLYGPLDILIYQEGVGVEREWYSPLEENLNKKYKCYTFMPCPYNFISKEIYE